MGAGRDCPRTVSAVNTAKVKSHAKTMHREKGGIIYPEFIKQAFHFLLLGIFQLPFLDALGPGQTTIIDLISPDDLQQLLSFGYR